MLWLIFFASLALSQPSLTSLDIGPRIKFDIPDAMEVAKCFQERQIFKDLDISTQKTIANLEKENDLLRQEIALKDRIHDIDQREIESKDRAVKAMSEVADRAIKLAEVKKPSSMIETWGPLAAIAIIVVTIASVL